ncbi:hypothetical protein [Catenuloplanes atrovinosus]|uniref:Uncharacterized protein n=1 Tax=Catenuloplanes atrovinosus TaxID=137266 RepID=A0AAE3YMX8_9ACTN|nr:hypothetical protein [Catenuloplanes atrovinosus]MDR7275440.1 hypothetical protein [Catenuloplanes atrovinosus]
MTTMERTATIAAIAGLLGIALFQLALALGAPLGQAAWGGAHAGTLPRELRVASVVSLLVWTAAATLVLSHAGLGPLSLPGAVTRWAVWALCGLLVVGSVMNIASSSPWERYFWGPYALVMAVLCGVVARGAAAGPM